MLAAGVITYAALPLSAALHGGVIIWTIEQDFLLFRIIEDATQLLPLTLRRALNGLIEVYAAFLGATVFAFLLSWIGFALLLPIFHVQRKLGWDGWLPTTLIGAALGALAVMPLSLGPLDFASEARMMFSGHPAPYFTAMGALHAATFWACLCSLPTKKPRIKQPQALPLFLDENIQNPRA